MIIITLLHSELVFYYSVNRIIGTTYVYCVGGKFFFGKKYAVLLFQWKQSSHHKKKCFVFFSLRISHMKSGSHCEGNYLSIFGFKIK